MSHFLARAEELFPYTLDKRRDFHRHPELGFEEKRTAGIVAQELRDLGLDVKEGVARTGVIAHLTGGRPGPLVFLRFDMDALPVTEQTGAAYASENPGVMHACGHDGHVAAGLTVARMLHERREQLAGNVRFCFQPAEEGAGGAKGMIEAGALADPRPDVVLGLHLWNDRPLGWLGITDGPVMAAADEFNLRVVGRGGHAASPHQTADPIPVAAQIITALQAIVSRNVSPLQTAVLSVTMLRSGSAFNVIPPDAEMKGTIRTFVPEVRTRVLERFRRTVEGVASALECSVELDLWSVTPPVVNDAAVAGRVRATAARLLQGSEIDADSRTMGSEDMSYYLTQVPGCFFFVGSADAARGLDAPHHHPKFDFDEAVLPRAVALMAGAAGGYLGLEA